MNEIIKSYTGSIFKESDISKLLSTDSKLSLNTIYNYTKAIAHFFYWILKQGLEPYQVNKKVIGIYKRHLIEIGRANPTVNFKLKAIKKFYNMGIESGKIDSNPVDGIAYEPEDEFIVDYKCFKDRQVEIMLDKLRQDKTEKGLQRYSIILCLLFTGLRASELCNLKFENIIFDGNITGLTYNEIKRKRKLTPVAIKIVRGKGGKNRIVEFNKEMLSSVLEYRKAVRLPGENFFFTTPNNSKQKRTPVNRFNLNYLTKQVSKKYLGVNGHTHMTRHTFVTLALEKGCPIESVSEVAGHSSIDITNRYNHRKREVLKYFSGMLTA